MQMSLYVVRAFVKMRELLVGTKELAGEAGYNLRKHPPMRDGACPPWPARAERGRTAPRFGRSGATAGSGVGAGFMNKILLPLPPFGIKPYHAVTVCDV